jgi:ribose 5-phosphate isomerase B
VKIAFGTDERCVMTEALRAHVQANGHEIVECGEGIDWREVGLNVGRVVAANEAAMGIVCCHTGTGVSIAANKVSGVRAALCTDAYTAEGARRWNDANVLAIGLRLTTATVACEMFDAFVATACDPVEREPNAQHR